MSKTIYNLNKHEAFDMLIKKISISDNHGNIYYKARNGLYRNGILINTIPDLKFRAIQIRLK